MIKVTDSIWLDEHELKERFIRSSGPGGQNVNKLASAVELRFDVRRSPSLVEPVRERLLRIAGRHVTQEGILVIKAQRHRTQERNREDALARLVGLIQDAAKIAPPRRRTRPPKTSRLERLESKSRRSAVKSLREKPRHDD